MKTILMTLMLLSPAARASDVSTTTVLDTTAAKSPSGQIADLEALTREDYNAVRRARYALRKTKDGSPEREAAEKSLKDSKQKLKDDRLKLRDLRRHLEHESGGR